MDLPVTSHGSTESSNNKCARTSTRTRRRRRGRPSKEYKATDQRGLINEGNLGAASTDNKTPIEPTKRCQLECPNLRQYVAIDCEFVGVGPGGSQSVLARVSVISGDGACLLDTFVKVREKVTDFRR